MGRSGLASHHRPDVRSPSRMVTGSPAGRTEVERPDQEDNRRAASKDGVEGAVAVRTVAPTWPALSGTSRSEGCAYHYWIAPGGSLKPRAFKVSSWSAGSQRHSFYPVSYRSETSLVCRAVSWPRSRGPRDAAVSVAFEVLRRSKPASAARSLVGGERLSRG